MIFGQRKLRMSRYVEHVGYGDGSVEDFVTVGICQSRLELSKTICILFAVYRCKT